MNQVPTNEQRRIWFSGRVQGVGFRYTAFAIAERMAVVGYVRNLADGRVYLVVEGSPDELDRYIGVVQQQMAGNITSMETEQLRANGEFDEFHIRW